jgi:predicted DNA-binding WGR domain protein
MVRWIKANRYYTASLQADLFGAWILLLNWGDRYQRSGQMKQLVYQSEQDAWLKLQDIAKRRQKDGYKLIQRSWLVRPQLRS